MVSANSIRQKTQNLDILILILLSLLLVAARSVSYLFFHTSVEIFSVIVAFSIFLFTWNSRKITRNNYFLFIGIGYLFVGIIDFVHTLAYKGMGVFPGVIGANAATQLWIAGRYILALSVFIAPIFLIKKLNEKLTLVIYLIITILIILSIFYWKIFPASYIDGVGLTPFKRISEYIVIVLFVCALIFLYKLRNKIDKTVFILLTIAFVLNIVAEVSFTLYFDVYDIFNMLGHLAKLFSYYLIYKAIIATGLTKPYNLLFLELEQMSKKKDEFMSVASHELKNPIASIKAYAQILQRKLIDRKDVKNAELISKIERQANKINKLVDDLLDVSKIESGQMIFNYAKFNIDNFVKDVISDYQSTSIKHKIQIEGKVGVKVMADKDRISQVLGNLISNALKYSPQAGKVIVKLERIKNDVTISVQDFGIGIASDMKKSIFEKYYRTVGGRRTAEGSGLGLYISSRIIRAHGGKIWVESKKGKGSTFSFSLPVV